MAVIDGKDFDLVNGATDTSDDRAKGSFDEAIKLLWSGIGNFKPLEPARGRRKRRPMAVPNSFRRQVASKFDDDIQSPKHRLVQTASVSRLAVPQYQGKIPMRREDEERTTDAVLTTVQRLSREIQRWRKIAFYHGMLADADLNDRINSIRMGLTGANGTLNGQEVQEIRALYNEQWFLNLPYTMRGKQRIAECLVEEYGKKRPIPGAKAPSLWQRIADGDPATLRGIAGERFLSVNDEAYEDDHRPNE